MEEFGTKATKNHAPSGKGPIISSSASLTVVGLTYIIDLEKKETYTFYKKDGKQCIAIDSLSAHREDMFYRLSALQTVPRRVIQYLPKNNFSVIAGKRCLDGPAISEEETIFFKYTEQPMKVVSPLNCYIPNCPYQIMAITVGVNQRSALFHFQVKSIYEQKVDDKLFKIPSSAVLKRKTPNRYCKR
jgi:hypothetical protein